MAGFNHAQKAYIEFLKVTVKDLEYGKRFSTLDFLISDEDFLSKVPDVDKDEDGALKPEAVERISLAAAKIMSDTAEGFRDKPHLMVQIESIVERKARKLARETGDEKYNKEQDPVLSLVKQHLKYIRETHKPVALLLKSVGMDKAKKFIDAIEESYGFSENAVSKAKEAVGVKLKSVKRDIRKLGNRKRGNNQERLEELGELKKYLEDFATLAGLDDCTNGVFFVQMFLLENTGRELVLYKHSSGLFDTLIAALDAACRVRRAEEREAAAAQVQEVVVAEVEPVKEVKTEGEVDVAKDAPEVGDDGIVADKKPPKKKKKASMSLADLAARVEAGDIKLAEPPPEPEVVEEETPAPEVVAKDDPVPEDVKAGQPSAPEAEDPPAAKQELADEVALHDVIADALIEIAEQVRSGEILEPEEGRAGRPLKRILDSAERLGIDKGGVAALVAMDNFRNRSNAAAILSDALDVAREKLAGSEQVPTAKERADVKKVLSVASGSGSTPIKRLRDELKEAERKAAEKRSGGDKTEGKQVTKLKQKREGGPSGPRR